MPNSLLRPRCQTFANLWTRKNHHRRRGTAATPQWRNHRKPIMVVVAPLPWSSKIGLGSKAIKNNTKKFEIDIDSAEDLFLWMVRNEPFNGWVTLNHKSMDVLTTSKLPKPAVGFSENRLSSFATLEKPFRSGKRENHLHVP